MRVGANCQQQQLTPRHTRPVAAGVVCTHTHTQVALPHAIQELPDSQLAPAVGAGARVLYVSAVGEHAQPASVIAVQTDAW